MYHTRIAFLPLVLLTGLFFGSCRQNKPQQRQAPATAEAIDTVAPLSAPKTHRFGLDYVMGKFDPASHPDFTLIDAAYADRNGLYMRKDAYQAFLRMHAAAKAAGHSLVIRSAARNFDYQKGIWERKWNGERRLSSGENAAEAYPDAEGRALAILKYSSMPGTSRHHWGTDIDLNAFNNDYFEKGEGGELYQWLTAHAAEFGFCQPYTPKDNERPHGYNEEKWHWSYLPVALPLTQLAKGGLRDSMISGFKGAEAAPGIQVVSRYVLGINQDCLHER